MVILRFAWRNLWRNSRRTAITLAAVGLNTAILIISYSLMDGLLVHMVSNATNLVVGEAQIHAPNYLASRSLYESLADPELVLRELHDRNINALGYQIAGCNHLDAPVGQPLDCTLSLGFRHIPPDRSRPVSCSLKLFGHEMGMVDGDAEAHHRQAL